MTIPCENCCACCIILPGTISLANDPQVPAKYNDKGFLKAQGTRCAALIGSIGISARCDIYANRPKICVDYQIGGSACLEDRRRATVRGQSPNTLLTPEEQAAIDTNPIEVVKAK